MKLPLYARHGIKEMWLVNFTAGEVKIWLTPAPEGVVVAVTAVLGQALSCRRECTPPPPRAWPRNVCTNRNLRWRMTLRLL